MTNADGMSEVMRKNRFAFAEVGNENKKQHVAVIKNKKG